MQGDNSRSHKETVSTIRGIFPWLSIKKSQDDAFLWVIENREKTRRMEIKGISDLGHREMQMTDGSTRFKVKNIEHIKKVLDETFSREAFEAIANSDVPANYINIHLILVGQAQDNILLMMVSPKTACYEMPCIQNTNWFVFRRLMIFQDFATSNFNTKVVRLYPNAHDFLVTVSLPFDSSVPLMSHIQRKLGKPDSGETIYRVVKVCDIDTGQLGETSRRILKRYWNDLPSSSSS